MFGGCRGLELTRSLGRGSGPFLQEQARGNTGLRAPELQCMVCRRRPAQGQADLNSSLGAIHRAARSSVG